MELRLVLTVDDVDRALAFYRDALGLEEVEAWEGAEQLAEPVVTPWNDRNVRVRLPDGMQLTLFSVVD